MVSGLSLIASFLLPNLYIGIVTRKFVYFAMISASDIKKFQQLYREEFGVDISTEDATEQGVKLLTLMSHAYQPMTQPEYDKTMSARKSTIESVVNSMRV
jgi:hypothetical protein